MLTLTGLLLAGWFTSFGIYLASHDDRYIQQGAYLGILAGITFASVFGSYSFQLDAQDAIRDYEGQAQDD
ncbi:hypothetical protein ASF72_06930 [Arthrobacter sp. Leaf141]|nr:hypothetical protein ASF72_06930 [Arthrobacter sp. Leaf141]